MFLIKKLHPNVLSPKYETEFSSGMDLHAANEQPIYIEPKTLQLIPCGISLFIDHSFEVQIRSRSGLALKNGIFVLNSPGTIDADYRGEIKVILMNLGNEVFKVKFNDRIAQMVICPIKREDIIEVDKLPYSSRGEGGFGSTGM